MTDSVDGPQAPDSFAGPVGPTGADDGSTGADDGAAGPETDGSSGDGADRGDRGDVGSDDGAVPGRSRVGLIVSVVVALVAVAFVVVLATREPATERRAKSPLVGKIAPALVGETLDGGSFDIDDHTDQWVVVNFFATWCGPCVEEHPELVAFDQAHRTAGDASVVSVVYNERPEVVRDFFAERGGEWPVVADGGLAAVDYGVIKVPETYLVAPGGVVVQKYTGGVTSEMIESDIAAVEAAVAAEQGQGGGS